MREIAAKTSAPAGRSKRNVNDPRGVSAESPKRAVMGLKRRYSRAAKLRLVAETAREVWGASS